MPEIAMKPDCPVPGEQHGANPQARYSFPFPVGPVIPRPDADWPTLWPGLVNSELNRHKDAASVLVSYYHGSPTDPGWRKTRGRMTTRLDLSFRNGRARMHSQGNSEAKGANDPLTSLNDWLESLKGTDVARDMKMLIENKLKRDFQHAYRAGRNNARTASLQFAPPHYPKVGQDPQCEVGVTSWSSTRYGESTRRHVQELLSAPAGEWNLLTLLFLKLLHTHLSWLAPSEIREERKKYYYRPLLRHLRLCAKQPRGPKAHPLADTAAGIWQNLRRVKKLLHDKNEPLFPEHSDALDPTNDLLPDSLHMGSILWVNECVSEVKQILRWMDEQVGGNEWEELVSWVDDVANLAWEMASARTDPFAIGGLGLVGDNSFMTAQIFKRFTEDWLANVKGVKACVYLLHGNQLKKKQVTSLKQLPSRFKSAFVSDEAPGTQESIAQINHTIRALEWGERAGQLRLFYQTTCDLLISYGLTRFQTQQEDSA